jgi:uncharacterized membrane protein
MTTFAAWRFDDPEGAERAEETLSGAVRDGLVNVLDQAVVTWPQDAAKPTVRHGHQDQWRGTGWGAFWGLLFGGLFFVPLLGAAAGAAIGGISRTLNAVGLSEDQLTLLREQVTPGSSMLCVVTEDDSTDRVAERFHGVHSTLVASTLTDTERSALLDAFG